MATPGTGCYERFMASGIETVGLTGHGACLNCGTALLGRYCHACGQSEHVHRTLMSVGHDLLHGVFHFEGKIWRTLPMLVLHPGRLTRRYIDGERANFVSPLALFLFTVFLMFATFSALSGSDTSKGFIDGLSDSSVQVDKALRDTAAQLQAAQARRATLVAARRPTDVVDRQIASLRSDAASMTTLRDRLRGPGEGRITVHSSLGWLDAALQRARENPGLVIYKVQSAAYKYSWLLIFLSTPLVASLFLWRRRFPLYDHATFVTYSIGFMSLLVIALELASAARLPSALLVSVAMLAPLAHMFVQLRGTYGLGVFAALWRTVFLFGFALVALILFVMGVIVIEVAH